MDSTSQSARSRWAALVSLGFLASLWALFQWGELVAARAGVTPFCSLGGNFDCAAVWDSAFARSVHNSTQVPVAGWGLMWGFIAFVLPLLALADPARLAAGLGSALRLTAAAGAGSVVGLAVMSAVAHAVCIGCIGTYLVVGAWSALAWTLTKADGMKEPQRGLMWAGGLAVLGYAVLFVPGSRTPHALVDAGKDAMKNSVVAPVNPVGPPAVDAGAAQPAGKNTRFDGPGTGDPARDEQLQRFVGSLEPDVKQLMSDLLGWLEEQKPADGVPPARAVIGKPDAPVKIVDFTDPLCGHCAALHATLDEVAKYVGDDAFTVEPHYFPLDHNCNDDVERKGDTDIRCQAVRAQICLEGDPPKLAAAQNLIFANQQGLTTEKMWELLKGFGDRKKIEACMKSPDTAKKLLTDIAAAKVLKLEGTPLVIMNGKIVKPFGPLLFALILTHGSTKHPAFAALPPPKPLPPEAQ